LEALHNHHAHVKVSLGTVHEAGGLTGAELASRSTSDAFIPACTCQFCHHFVNHRSLLLLLQYKARQIIYVKRKTIRHDKSKFKNAAANHRISKQTTPLFLKPHRDLISTIWAIQKAITG